MFENFVVRIWMRIAPLFRSVLNQVKTYSKVLFPALVIKLNEQCLGSVLSKKTGLLTRYTKTGYYKTQALNTKHVVACAKNHWTAQTWGNPPQKQLCHLSRIIRETPDFGPYLPVSRLEYEILPDNRRILPFLVESTFRQ